MPNSLKAKLSNLRYKGQITDAEYKELIDKLNGHDRQMIEEIKAKIDFEEKWLMDVWHTDEKTNRRMNIDDIRVAMDGLRHFINEKVEVNHDKRSKSIRRNNSQTWI